MLINDFKKNFPILAIEQEQYMIAADGSVSLVYQVLLPEVYSLAAEELNDLNYKFSKSLRYLPKGTIVQKQDFFKKKKFQKLISEEDSFLSKADNRFFFEKETLDHSCYIIFTKTPVGLKNHSIIQETKKFIESFSDLSEFKRAVDLMSSYLQEYFKFEQLKGDQIIHLLEKYIFLTEENISAEIDFNIKDFQVGKNKAEIYAISSVNQLPAIVESAIKDSALSTEKTNFFLPFTHPIGIDLEGNHLYNQVIYIADNKDVFAKIKLKQRNFKSMQLLSKENGVSNRILDEYVDESIENDYFFVYQHYNLISWAEDEGEFQKNAIEITDAFKKMDTEYVSVNYSLKDLFFGNIPGNANAIKSEYRFIGTSDLAACMINVDSSYKQTGTGSGVLVCDKKNGNPLRLDLWHDPVKKGLIVNRNRLLFGPSGTGKSFFINHLASQYYDQGHHVVIMDIGNSYRKLCYLVKGQYLEYQPDKPIRLNPFMIKELTIEKKDLLASIMLLLWKGDGMPFSTEEKQILFLYLDEFYSEKVKKEKVFPKFATFYEFVLSCDIDPDQGKYFDKTSFRIALSEFYDGNYKDVLNFEDPIDLFEERFIVFELDSIKDHPVLFPLIVLMIIDTIMEKIMKKSGVPKSIFIDECWKPISRGNMLEFIKYLYKTVRKFFGEVVIATQDLEDIINTEAGPAMINNSDTILLLSHKKKLHTLDNFKKYLSFTESDISKLFATEVGEVFVRMGGLSRNYKIAVPPERYACYTSNGDENKQLYDNYRQTENMEQTIRHFVEKKNENEK